MIENKFVDMYMKGQLICFHKETNYLIKLRSLNVNSLFYAPVGVRGVLGNGYPSEITLYILRSNCTKFGAFVRSVPIFSKIRTKQLDYMESSGKGCKEHNTIVLLHHIKDCTCNGKKMWTSAPSEAYDLLQKCLELNPLLCITAKEALNHPFLQNIG